MNHRWWLDPCKPFDTQALEQATARQQQLTKPAGSLGRLESVAVQLAGLQGQVKPSLDHVWIAIFAGDHGVVAEGVSAFPQEVTGQMLLNFVSGGAAISVLARQLGASLEVVDLGTVTPALDLPGVRHLRVGPGTANFLHGPAMTVAQGEQALQAGRDSVLRAVAAGTHLFIGGEMGIGNTTAASALACALLDCPVAHLVGPGTGLDAAGVSHKAQVIERAQALHAAQRDDPLQTLFNLGGFEIAALAGAYLACAQQGVAVLVDGFICSVAALVAVRVNPGCRPWLLFGHRGAEPGHRHVLETLGAEPLLDLGLRLGEGSGAALAVPLLRLACDLHGQMATFAEAAVADRPA
ncbi:MULTISPECIES: nicotinate-nucleotide--dimethylbenzimidazole phosphoribosyltransferase [unclassified Pseudomonas]|uniref:nicotinate-nucleotide--dimethylbenzimidazole phosphoribosyltransferase n=1 Tax=unclassified Pseudomonas TaxID=196821 RepID=UPI000876263B|nr:MULTISPECIES: nicotinate-nucleotide--dimethylbenzimidazole phosphoribosyltransferase [unclassified Pseudomonas]SCZ29860.1 nicotinate-nucleotide-dimethylbenzimidazole phosphoribosyltransferase [Pseudomonas sp. NFACC44-2]SDA63294.1 nicotinate-nucleotide-dimethylbenzimidazole phosphoribosyltransferase [Pseudomonas sp. NFACC51]SFI74620.1 nicotinate-nucleotide-dimethylbenzimidazole phosphoribosyltransferase [Pseudomonas sp. NFACC54]SFS79146.1 nicotinate-nucleotide-dimethylbenzimidazole phosphorib